MVINSANSEHFLKDLEDFCLYERRQSPGTTAWVQRITHALLKRYGIITASKDFARRMEIDLRKEGKKISTISRYLHAVELWHECLHNGDKLQLRKPRETKHRIEYLTRDEVKRLLAVCDNPRDRAIIAVLATTGLRNKELCQLRLDDVDLDRRVLLVRDHGEGLKTYEESSVVMTHECSEILREYLRDRPMSRSDHVFLGMSLNKTQTKQHPGITQAGVRTLVKKLGRRAGLKQRVWVHLFRHTTGTQMAASGVNLALVQRQLRHRDIKSTMVYVTADESILRASMDQRFSYELETI